MTASTVARFNGLHQDNQKITFDTYVEEQAIKLNIVMHAACKETGKKAVSEKVTNAIIDNLPSATASKNKR